MRTDSMTTPFRLGSTADCRDRGRIRHLSLRSAVKDLRRRSAGRRLAPGRTGRDRNPTLEQGTAGTTSSTGAARLEGGPLSRLSRSRGARPPGGSRSRSCACSPIRSPARPGSGCWFRITRRRCPKTGRPPPGRHGNRAPRSDRPRLRRGVGLARLAGPSNSPLASRRAPGSARACASRPVGRRCWTARRSCCGAPTSRSASTSSCPPGNGVSWDARRSISSCRSPNDYGGRRWSTESTPLRSRPTSQRSRTTPPSRRSWRTGAGSPSWPTTRASRAGRGTTTGR